MFFVFLNLIVNYIRNYIISPKKKYIYIYIYIYDKTTFDINFFLLILEALYVGLFSIFFTSWVIYFVF